MTEIIQTLTICLSFLSAAGGFYLGRRTDKRETRKLEAAVEDADLERAEAIKAKSLEMAQAMMTALEDRWKETEAQVSALTARVNDLELQLKEAKREGVRLRDENESLRRAAKASRADRNAMQAQLFKERAENVGYIARLLNAFQAGTSLPERPAWYKPITSDGNPTYDIEDGIHE